MIARLQCKNFNLAHYSKSIKGTNTILGILANHDKVQLQDKHNSKAIFLELCPCLSKILSRMMAPDTRVLVLQA